MFGLFLAFLVALDLSLPQVATMHVLAFMEYLLQHGMSASNIINHITATRTMLIIYNCDTAAFRDQRIPLFIKSVKIKRIFQPKLHFVIDEEVLKQIVSKCFLLQSPHTFIALYLFTFFSFLRLSNILPHSIAAFDMYKH